MPKKVLIFSVTYYPRLVGGDVVAVKEITDRIDPKEFEFHLITLRFDKNLPKEETIGNVRVYRLGFTGQMKESADSLKFPLHYNKYFFTVLGAWKAFRLSRKIKFDLSWSIMANYAGFAALFFKFLKPRIPFLLTLQEGDPFEYTKKRVGIFYPLFKMIFTRADAVQAISNYLARYAKEMGFKKEPVVIPNGVDINKFDIEISREERAKIREEFGLKENDVVLVTTSRLVIKNGIGDVIEALTKLPENVKFVVFGEGYLEQNLKSQISNLKLEKRVFLRGFVDHKEMPKYLKACDIFIRPSLSEGFGVSFVEAMAARLPVVATRLGGIADFLEDPSNSSGQVATGYVCEPQNPENVAKTINRAINDVGQNRIIDNAYKMVREKYNWDLIASKMKEVFNLLKK